MLLTEWSERHRREQQSDRNTGRGEKGFRDGFRDRLPRAEKKHRARAGGAAGHTTRGRGSEDEQHSEDIVGS